MVRPTNPIPTQRLVSYVPVDVFSRLAALLYSEAEERIPHGALSDFVTERLREFFASERVDLAPFVGCEPGLFFVSGSPESIEQLTNSFKEKV